MAVKSGKGQNSLNTAVLTHDLPSHTVLSLRLHCSISSHCLRTTVNSHHLSTAKLFLLAQDLPRTYPEDAWLREAEGQEALRSVLAAYSMHDPQVGVIVCLCLGIIVLRVISSASIQACENCSL